MKKRILNVAFLGAGKIAHKLAETFLGLPKMFNLYSVASRDINKANDFKEKYHFGYAQSEALVKLERTPNNTFPVYWFSYKQRRTVPFPR